MTPEEIVAQAEAQGLQLVRFLYCDNGGVVRGKSTHVSSLARRIQSGIGLVKGMQSFTSIDTLAPDATYGPVGEIRLVPDPDTFVVLPYAPRSGQMLVNMVQLDHSPWPLDPRWFLQRMEQRAAEAGLAFEAAFENEFYLAVQTAGRLPAGRPEPVLQRDRDGLDRGRHPGHHRGAHGPGADGRAVPPRARLGPAGAVDAPRAGAPRGRQPGHLPPDRARRRGPARADRLARPEAVRGPGGQRRAPPLEHLGHRAHREPPGGRERPRRPEPARRGTPIAGVIAHLPGPARAHDAERQLVPPPPAALLELGVHRLGHREPRGGGPRPDPLLGRRGGLDEPRAEGQRRERQPVHLARRRDGRGPRRHRARARPGRPGRRRPGQPDRRRAGEARDPPLPGDGERGPRRAREGRGPRRAPWARRWRPSTSRCGAPRPPRTPSRTRRSSSSSHFFKY